MWSPVTAAVVAVAAVLALLLSTDLPEAMASVVLIMLALSGWGRALVCGAVVQWLGRVWYSLYLLHVPVVILSAALPWSRWACVGISVSAALAISEVAYRLVEAPGIVLGRRLTTRRGAVPSIPQ